MYHLKLIKARSYVGKVKATASFPHVYVEDEDDANFLVRTGYFKLVEDETANALEPRQENVEDNSFKTLDEMNISELETFATYKGVSLKGIRKKDDIIKKLRDELSEEELKGVIVYGSPTMTELEDN